MLIFSGVDLEQAERLMDNINDLFVSKGHTNAVVHVVVSYHMGEEFPCYYVETIPCSLPK